MENENWNLDDILSEWLTDAKKPAAELPEEEALPEAEPAEEPLYEEELPAEEPATEFAEEVLPEETAEGCYEEFPADAPATEFGEEPVPEPDYYAAETEEPEAPAEDAFTERQAALLGEEPEAPKKKREKKAKEPKAEGEKWRRAPKDVYYDDPKPAKKKKKKGGLWALIIIAAVLVLLAAAVIFGCSKVQQVETIYPGVTVEGIDFSNSTAEDMATELTRLGHERYDYYTVDVDLPLDNHITLNTGDVGLTFSVKDAVLKAWHFGRDDGFFGNALQYAQSRFLGKPAGIEDAGIAVTMDENALRSLIQTVAVDIDAQLLENSVVITDSTIELIKGASGMTIDEEMLFDMIRDAFLHPTEETLVYESEPMLDEEFDFQGLYNEHYSELVEGQLAYNPACLNKASTEEELDEATEAAKAAAEAQEAAMAAANAGDAEEAPAEEQGESFADRCYAQGATITDWEEGEKYRVLPSSEGWSFDVAEAERLWAAAGYGDTVVIPLTVEKPVNSSEDLTNMLFADALSKNWTMYRFGFTDGYTEDVRTSLAGSTTNRINNVKKACDLINDTILMPGEVFEYNATLGQRTEEAGWLPAPAYANGEVRQEAGGGICQVSSTLYNAALYSNLEIVERECHQFKVAYLPWGLDATVSWGWPDFKFRNDKDYPIKIKAWVDEDTNYCCFQILGTDVEHQYVIMQFNNWYFYDTTGEYHDANGDPLSIGMEAATWRLVYNDGDDYKTDDPISNTYEAHSKYNDHSEDIEARNVPLS